MAGKYGYGAHAKDHKRCFSSPWQNHCILQPYYISVCICDMKVLFQVFRNKEYLLHYLLETTWSVHCSNSSESGASTFDLCGKLWPLISTTIGTPWSHNRSISVFIAARLYHIVNSGAHYNVTSHTFNTHTHTHKTSLVVGWVEIFHILEVTPVDCVLYSLPQCPIVYQHRSCHMIGLLKL